jgi:hypothetical protein
MKTKIKKTLVLWNKTDISTMLNISTEQLDRYLSEKVKESVKFNSHRIRFRDAQVLEMLADLFPAKTDAERREMIGYKPH